MNEEETILQNYRKVRDSGFGEVRCVIIDGKLNTVFTTISNKFTTKSYSQVNNSKNKNSLIKPKKEY